jgi:hypothetical protein
VVVSHYEDSIASQIVVSVGGIVIMSAIAYAASWFRSGPARGNAA